MRMSLVVSDTNGHRALRFEFPGPGRNTFLKFMVGALAEVGHAGASRQPTSSKLYAKDAAHSLFSGKFKDLLVCNEDQEASLEI